MAETTYQRIEDTSMFKAFESVARTIWNEVSAWNSFARNTVGTQMVRALDSVGANLAEGAGRHGSADSLHFFVIARASAREGAYWIRVADERKLLRCDGSALLKAIDSASRSLNTLISYRRNKVLTTRETRAAYAGASDEDNLELDPAEQHITQNTQHSGEAAGDFTEDRR